MDLVLVHVQFVMGSFLKDKMLPLLVPVTLQPKKQPTLQNFVIKFTMIVRRDEMRACKAMQHRVENTKNIEILWNTDYC